VVHTGSLALERGDVCLPPPRPSLPLSGHRGWCRLRRLACLLYQSEPLAIAHAHLEAEIESERLLFRRDLSPAADVGLRQDLTDMLVLNYSHVWLRIGLETVFGVCIAVPLAPEEAAQQLSAFIADYLLSSDTIEPAGSSDGSRVQLSRHVLKRFLMLVLFLDRAKLTRLLDHNPCLFQPSASIKSSREMLLNFSRKYLSGEGDFVKHLSNIGCAVTQVQVWYFNTSALPYTWSLHCN
jgi:abnormal spindle-like microcephaly-associated protein